MGSSLAFTLYIAMAVGLAGLFFGLSSLEHADPSHGALNAFGGILVYLLSWAYSVWVVAKG